MLIILQDLYAPGLALLKRNVRIHDTSRGCSLSSATTVSLSCEKPPMMKDLHRMRCQFYKLYELIQEMDLNLLIPVLLFSFIFFLDRT
jgi:hypothetical protein